MSWVNLLADGLFFGDYIRIFSRLRQKLLAIGDYVTSISSPALEALTCKHGCHHVPELIHKATKSHDPAAQASWDSTVGQLLSKKVTEEANLVER